MSARKIVTKFTKVIRQSILPDVITFNQIFWLCEITGKWQVQNDRLQPSIGRTLAAGNVVEEFGCLYISSVAADSNPISREQHREMGLPSADALKM